MYDSTVIPNRGAWIELETDASEVVAVRIDRNRKLPATVLVRALGWDTNESILDLFWNGKTDEDGLPVYDERIVRTLEKIQLNLLMKHWLKSIKITSRRASNSRVCS